MPCNYFSFGTSKHHIILILIHIGSIMKYISSLFLLLLLSTYSFAQVMNPVHWSWKVEQIKGDEYKIVFTAQIDKPYHTYGMYIADGGPVKTSFTFQKNPDFDLVGKMTETGPKVKEGVDDVFGINVKLFEEKAVFEQRIKLKKATTIKGSFEFMACDDKSCLPPDTKEFSIAVSADGKATEDVKKNPTSSEVDTSSKSQSAPNLGDTSQTAASDTIAHGSPCAPGAQGFTKGYFGKPIRDCGKQISTDSVWDAILQGFLWGLLAIFTPCVFPMIPLTVSFFTKRSEKKSKGVRDALIYAGSIVLIYFLLSLPLAFGLPPDSLNAFSTNSTVNIIFFLIFLFFAFSFFGFYDISLPSWIGNKTESVSDAGGVIGIFFMALTLIIVSFSCTGPLLGNVIGNVANSSASSVKLVLGMTVFGFALALPFALFALFPSLLKKMPKSGNWMTTFKVILGFVELIFAIKFLANADNVNHWGYVKREIFLVLWFMLGLALFLYLAGIYRFKTEHGEQKVGVVRYGLSGIALAFALYSGYGVYNHDLPLFSGFPPPMYYSLAAGKSTCPLNLNCYHDYCEALEAAKKANKPIMIDFTGWACVNCRRMEERVWKQPEVYKIINEDYILLSLYVDDKQALPEKEQYFSKNLGKQVKTVGNKWFDFEVTCFNNASQPYYVLISPDEKLLNEPRGYTPNVEEYKHFLECGLDGFKSIQHKP